MIQTFEKKKMSLMPWIIWSCGGLFYFYQFLIRVSPSYMAEELMETFQAQGLLLGILGAAYYYAYSPMQIPLGLILDKFGPKRILIMSCGVCIIGCLVFATSSNLTIACIGRFLMGIGSACAWIGSLKLASLWFPPERIGTVIGATMFLGTVGPFWAGPLFADLVDYIGWRQAMYCLSGVGFLLILFMIMVMRIPAPNLRKQPIFQSPQPSILTILKSTVFSSHIIINAIFAMLMYVPMAAFADLWGVSFIQDLYQIEKPLAANVVSSVFFGVGIGALIVSYFSDKIGSRRIPMIIGALGALIMYIFIIYIPGIPLSIMYVLTFLSGFFFSGQLMCFASAVEMTPVSSNGVVVGLTNMTVMLSGVIFEPLIGWLLDFSRHSLSIGGEKAEKIINYSLKDWQFSLSSIIICLILALILVFFIKETHPRSKITHFHS